MCTNPSISGRTAVHCDLIFPNAKQTIPVAKHAYLYNESEMSLAEFNTYANCEAPSGLYAGLLGRQRTRNLSSSPISRTACWNALVYS